MDRNPIEHQCYKVRLVISVKDILQGIKETNRRLEVLFADSAYKRSKLPDWAKEQVFLLQPVLRPTKVKGGYCIAEALDCRADTCVWATLVGTVKIMSIKPNQAKQ